MAGIDLPVLPEMANLWQQTLNWQPNTQQQRQFQQLYEQVLEGNRRLNLTRIKDTLEFWEKHLWDSIRAVAPLRQTSLPQQVIDIGTGGGFPGVPIAIARPNWTVCLLDSTQKKIIFLKTLVAALGIDNASTLCDRAEQLGQHRHHREHYDIALIRAVGSASICAEYTLPLVKIGGLAVLYRGQWTASDTQALDSIVEKLGGKVELVTRFTTPVSQSVRHCLYLRKVTPTLAAYPRSTGVPAQQPL